MAERSFNVASFPKEFKSLMEQVYEKPCAHKINKKEDQSTHFKAELSQR